MSLDAIITYGSAPISQLRKVSTPCDKEAVQLKHYINEMYRAMTVHPHNLFSQRDKDELHHAQKAMAWMHDRCPYVFCDQFILPAFIPFETKTADKQDILAAKFVLLLHGKRANDLTELASALKPLFNECRHNYPRTTNRIRENSHKIQWFADKPTPITFP